MYSLTIKNINVKDYDITNITTVLTGTKISKNWDFNMKMSSIFVVVKYQTRRAETYLSKS